jgi:hypothetical protein
VNYYYFTNVIFLYLIQIQYSFEYFVIRNFIKNFRKKIEFELNIKLIKKIDNCYSYSFKSIMSMNFTENKIINFQIFLFKFSKDELILLIKMFE